MAPNLITLLGFILILVNVALLLAIDPTLSGQHDHPWIYFSFAVGLWFYSTLDNVDGKQARRTGTSSALGELFDHGVDALNTTFGTLLTCAGFGLGKGESTLVSIWMAVLVFFFSTWETFHTGTLYLGFVNGPSEGITLACFYLILSGIYGASFWHQIIHVDLKLIHGPALSVPLYYIMLAGMYGLSLFTQIPVSIHRAFQHNRSMTLFQAFQQTLPVLVYPGLVWIWISAPHSRVLDQAYLTLICGTGVGFGGYAASIILHHLLHRPYPSPWEFLAPVAVMAGMMRVPGLGNTGWIDEVMWTRGVMVCTTVWYLLRVRVVILSFCGFLGIQAFRIPFPKAAGMQKTKKTVRVQAVRSSPRRRAAANQAPLQ